MKKTILIIFMCFIVVGSGFAEAPNGLAFLKIASDVRSSAMGEAGVVAGDAKAAASFNPALTALAEKTSASFAHHRWIQDTQMNFLQVQFPAFVNIGLSILSTGVEGIEVRTTPSPQPIDIIDSRDLAFALNIAHSLNSALHLGMCVKYIHEHIFYEDTDGIAFDFGILYRPSGRITAGASLLNWGKMSNMLNERPDLPLTTRFGVSYELPLKSAGSMLLAIGGTYVREEDFRGNLGLEWQPMEMVALRGGYLLNYDERSLTAGVGLHWKNFTFDFAYIPFDSDLGDSQRFGFTVDF
ncbi:MAG: PorV/PorQ family protein [candidate division Zixibacteria bacterium]|nr:PorV/PorQ family protein [Candidatus Tariuqbacter arcticus]